MCIKQFEFNAAEMIQALGQNNALHEAIDTGTRPQYGD